MRNSLIKTLIAGLSFILGMYAAVATAEPQDTKAFARSIRIAGRKAVTVNNSDVRLADIADVSSALTTDDEAVIALKKIVVEKSPAPGQNATLSASEVLEKLKMQGINLTEVIYTLPRVITVTRASRNLSASEVTAAIQAFFDSSKREVTLKSVNYPQEIAVTPGTTQIEATPFNTSKPGQMGFNISASAPDEEPVRFDVTTQVDEWGQLPVAKRPLPKGSVVSADDVMMARLNLSALPGDAARESGTIIGLATSNDIGYGELFRRNKLIIPPTILSGSRVTMMYKSALFDASATGTAMESGIVGQEIKIRNDSSKKIVSGKVVEPGLVEVRP